MNRHRTNKYAQNQDNQSSLIMFLLLFSGFVAIIGLIYIYGDFSQRKNTQLAGFIEVRRKTPAASSPIEDTSKFVNQEQNTSPQPLPSVETDSESIVEQILTGATSTPAEVQNENEQTLPVETEAVKETVETELIVPEKKEEKKQKEEPRTKTPKNTTRLFFIRATDSGYLSLRGTAIEIGDAPSPLTFTIEALLRGPSLSERRHGMYSLIPEGSRLISATVKDGIAYLDFSEDFQFNPLGTDGYQAQLQQVVYTATEFPSVQYVQILLEGKKVDYLHEGIYVGNPLSRESFRSS